MSSAPARTLPSLGRALRGIAWTALFAVLAAGAAGLIAQASHTPGTPARADLTAEGDALLNARLDQATSRLEGIAGSVDGLADTAKTALEEITGADQTKVQDSLAHGDELAASITTDTRALQAALAGLPGDESDADLRYSNDTLVRRAAVLAALDATAGLQANWEQVTAHALEASRVSQLIAQHDQVVLDAAAKGRSREYANAAATLHEAILTVASVLEQRTKLIADTGRTVLDEWIERNRDYDVALQALYVALDQSGGTVTVKVQAARRAERAAFDQLPPDRRTIIVIIAEIARGGLTQAVLAIEDARGRLEDALAEAVPGPGEPGAPSGTEAPGGTEAPRQTLAPGESSVPLP
jgi:hypothetical protein